MTQNWLGWVCLAMNISTVLALMCFRPMARKVPVNYILLTIFTLTEAYFIGNISASVE